MKNEDFSLEEELDQHSLEDQIIQERAAFEEESQQSEVKNDP